MKTLEKNKYYIWLSLIPKLGSKRKLDLLKIHKAPERIYQLKKEELIKIKGIGEETAQNIIKSKKERLINLHIQLMQRNSIDIINIEDNEYPQNLKEIYDPPVSIFIKGNKNILNKSSIAIVGCRDCSEYGVKATMYFSSELAKRGIVIVSGMAKGIDSFAHMGSLCGKGETIAVVANGLDIVYPKENEMLMSNIIQNRGAIISEYPCMVKPDKMNFPARNRIVSGLCKGIIVVEAKSKSGTLITVDFALEQGRDVFVVPGNINSINSVGTNNLIKQGARVVTNVEDVLIF